MSHGAMYDALAAELRQVLRPSGALVVSTTHPAMADLQPRTYEELRHRPAFVAFRLRPAA